MTFRIFIVLSIFAVSSCNTKSKSENSITSLPIQGTWQLVSETKIEKNDTLFTEKSKDQRMIKILNDTHFSFLNHDLNKGQDSTALFVAGGGTYELKGNEYIEHLDYCSAREWERNTFHFIVTIQNDTLIQSGREKIEGTDVDRIIIEKYFRVP